MPSKLGPRRTCSKTPPRLTWRAPSALLLPGSLSLAPQSAKVLLQDYMRRLQRTGAEDSYELLSPREREILQLVAEGKSSKEIANLLNLSVYTVETHRAKLMQKLNLRNVPEVILYAVRKGIIS